MPETLATLDSGDCAPADKQQGEKAIDAVTLARRAKRKKFFRRNLQHVVKVLSMLRGNSMHGWHGTSCDLSANYGSPFSFRVFNLTDNTTMVKVSELSEFLQLFGQGIAPKNILNWSTSWLIEARVSVLVCSVSANTLTPQMP